MVKKSLFSSGDDDRTFFAVFGSDVLRATIPRSEKPDGTFTSPAAILNACPLVEHAISNAVKNCAIDVITGASTEPMTDQEVLDFLTGMISKLKLLTMKDVAHVCTELNLVQNAYNTTSLPYWTTDMASVGAFEAIRTELLLVCQRHVLDRKCAQWAEARTKQEAAPPRPEGGAAATSTSSSWFSSSKVKSKE